MKTVGIKNLFGVLKKYYASMVSQAAANNYMAEKVKICGGGNPFEEHRRALLGDILLFSIMLLLGMFFQVLPLIVAMCVVIAIHLRGVALSFQSEKLHKDAQETLNTKKENKCK